MSSSTRRRRWRVAWWAAPLAPGEAAGVALLVIGLILAASWGFGTQVVPALLIAAGAGALLRLIAWLRIAGGRRF